MSEIPFQYLTTEKFQEVLSLAKIVKAEYDATGNSERTLEEVVNYSKSDAEMDLFAKVERLTFEERTELVAIMQIGREIENYTGKNWGEIYKRALRENVHASFVTDTGPPLSGYLEKGLQSVTRP